MYAIGQAYGGYKTERDPIIYKKNSSLCVNIRKLRKICELNGGRKSKEQS